MKLSKIFFVKFIAIFIFFVFAFAPSYLASEVGSLDPEKLYLSSSVQVSSCQGLRPETTEPCSHPRGNVMTGTCPKYGLQFAIGSFKILS